MIGCASQEKKEAVHPLCGTWRISLKSYAEAGSSDKIVAFESNGITTQGYLKDGIYTASMTGHWIMDDSAITVSQANGMKEVRPCIFDDANRFRILGPDGTAKVWALRFKD
jgi:hypothetical protein